MALTNYQRIVCRLIAQRRTLAGESYVAGGAALNEVIRAPRLSRDVDLFHDTGAAVEQSFLADCALFEQSGFDVAVVRQRVAFVEAEITRGGDRVLLQWVHDSAFRFFPLVEHEEFGLVLHPVDLATNKVLALVGRLEVRDWVDVIETSQRLQPLGYLAWAAVGKDPGFSPHALVEHAARSSRYSELEVRALSFAGPPPDAGELSRRWHRILDEARALMPLLPVDTAGKCVLDANGGLWRGNPEELPGALSQGLIHFHPGSIRGALPQIATEPPFTPY
jgi:hypothetical protein